MQTIWIQWSVNIFKMVCNNLKAGKSDSVVEEEEQESSVSNPKSVGVSEARSFNRHCRAQFTCCSVNV